MENKFVKIVSRSDGSIVRIIERADSLATMTNKQIEKNRPSFSSKPSDRELADYE